MLLPKLAPFAGRGPSKLLNVIVETPQGQRNKFKYEARSQCFVLGNVLPAGAVFPFDFGFVPGTLADDGDPLDVLILSDAPAYPGCVVRCRTIGVIEAEQRANSEAPKRNDRIIAVSEVAEDYAHIHGPKDLSSNLLKEYGHFFASYHALRGTKFTVLDVRGAPTAIKLIEASTRRAGKAKRSNRS